MDGEISNQSNDWPNQKQEDLVTIAQWITAFLARLVAPVLHENVEEADGVGDEADRVRDEKANESYL